MPPKSVTVISVIRVTPTSLFSLSFSPSPHSSAVFRQHRENYFGAHTISGDKKKPPPLFFPQSDFPAFSVARWIEKGQDKDIKRRAVIATLMFRHCLFTYLLPSTLGTLFAGLMATKDSGRGSHAE